MCTSYGLAIEMCNDYETYEFLDYLMHCSWLHNDQQCRPSTRNLVNPVSPIAAHFVRASILGNITMPVFPYIHHASDRWVSILKSLGDNAIDHEL